MKRKNVFIAVISVLLLILVFGTYQVLTPSSDQGETVQTSKGYKESELVGFVNYSEITSTGNSYSYAGMDQNGQITVVSGENRYGPFGNVLNVWNTQEEPLSLVGDLESRVLYHGNNTVEELGEGGMVMSAGMLEGEVIYHKVEYNTGKVEEIVQKSIERSSSSEDAFKNVLNEVGWYLNQNRSSELFDSYIVHGDDRIGEDFDAVTDFYIFGTDLVYTAVEDGKSFLVVDGIKQEEYLDVSNVTEIGGEIAYVGETSKKDVVVVGGEEQKSYDLVKQLTDIGGQAGYLAKEGSTKYVVLGGEETEEFGPLVVELDNLTDISGQPGYIARKLGGSYVMVGDSRSEEYDRVYDLKEIGGKAVFNVFNNSKAFLVDGNEKTKEFEDIPYFVSVGGELCYTGIDEEGKTHLIKGGKKLGEFDRVSRPVEIGGSVSVLFQDSKSEMEKLYFNGSISPGYDSIFSVTAVDGKPVFIAERNKRQYLVEFIEG